MNKECARRGGKRKVKVRRHNHVGYKFLIDVMHPTKTFEFKFPNQRDVPLKPLNSNLEGARCQF